MQHRPVSPINSPLRSTPETNESEKIPELTVSQIRNQLIQLVGDSPDSRSKIDRFVGVLESLVSIALRSHPELNPGMAVTELLLNRLDHAGQIIFDDAHAPRIRAYIAEQFRDGGLLKLRCRSDPGA